MYLMLLRLIYIYSLLKLSKWNIEARTILIPSQIIITRYIIVKHTQTYCCFQSCLIVELVSREVRAQLNVNMNRNMKTYMNLNWSLIDKRPPVLHDVA